MPSVVTGLSQSADVTAVNKALEGAGLSLDPMQVIGPDDSTPPLAQGISGPDIFTSDRAMAVPGINPLHHALTQFFRNESLDDRLGDLEIPESELDNYVEALERGRTIVAYFAKPDNVDKVMELFRGANLTNVRAF